MADTATLQARLAEAEEALHAVQIGRQVRMIGHDGKQTTFNSTNVGQLRAYIAELQRALGTATPKAPLRPYF